MKTTPLLLSTPALLLLVALLPGPLLMLVRVSLYEPPQGRGFYAPGTWTLANYERVSDAHGLQISGFTILFGLLVTVLTLLLAYPLALLLRTFSGFNRRLALGLVLLPKLGSLLAILFGLKYLLSANGPLNQLLSSDHSLNLNNNLFGAVVGEVLLIVPYAVLVLVLQLNRIDPQLELAARGLGASRWQTFCRVTLPLSLPGLLLAGELSLMWGLGGFSGPLFLGGPAQTTLSIEVHRQGFEYGRWPLAAALAVQLMLVVGGMLALSSLLRRWLGQR